MIVRRVVSSIVVVGIVVSSSRVVSSPTYVIRRYTKHILSEFKRKNFYLIKYHCTKEYH